MSAAPNMPLAGLRIIELGHYIAAPFATRLLADLGAEVIKVEPPEGDPVRGWGSQVEGNPVWFSVHGRNKLSVTLDLKSAEGKARVLELARRSDALVENFRPGQLERLYDMADCAADPHFRARGYVMEVADPLLGKVLHPAAPFRFDGVPPEAMVRWTGPAAGAHNAQIFEGLLKEDQR